MPSSIPGTGPFPFASVPLVVCRTTWDYLGDSTGFRAWIAVVGSVTALENPPTLMDWNLHKCYLVELAQAGVPVIETRVLLAGASGAQRSAVAGGINTLHEATGEELAVGATALAALPAAPLYARIDLVGAAAPKVMEAELVEPELFLGLAPGAARRYADALCARLTGPVSPTGGEAARPRFRKGNSSG